MGKFNIGQQSKQKERLKKILKLVCVLYVYLHKYAWSVSACVYVCTDIFEIYSWGALKYMIIFTAFMNVTEPKVQHWHSIWITRGRASQRQPPPREYKLLLSLQSSNVITICKSSLREINCLWDCFHLRGPSKETRVLTTSWFMNLTWTLVNTYSAVEDEYSCMSSTKLKFLGIQSTWFSLLKNILIDFFF